MATRAELRGKICVEDGFGLGELSRNGCWTVEDPSHYIKYNG